MKFGKGSQLLYRDGRVAYEKVNDADWGQWVSLLATYPVETMVEEEQWNKVMSKNIMVKVKHTEIKKECDRVPVFNADGSVNDEYRYFFKWSDEQVTEHYAKFMNFQVK